MDQSNHEKNGDNHILYLGNIATAYEGGIYFPEKMVIPRILSPVYKTSSKIYCFLFPMFFFILNIVSFL